MTENDREKKEINRLSLGLSFSVFGRPRLFVRPCVVSCYEQLQFLSQQATIQKLRCTACKPNHFLAWSCQKRGWDMYASDGFVKGRRRWHNIFIFLDPDVGLSRLILVSFGPEDLKLKAPSPMPVLGNCSIRIDLAVYTVIVGINCLTLSCKSDASKLTVFLFAFPQFKKPFSTTITHAISLSKPMAWPW
jgi:hypothetical protein